MRRQLQTATPPGVMPTPPPPPPGSGQHSMGGGSASKPGSPPLSLASRTRHTTCVSDCIRMSRPVLLSRALNTPLPSPQS